MSNQPEKVCEEHGEKNCAVCAIDPGSLINWQGELRSYLKKYFKQSDKKAMKGLDVEMVIAFVENLLRDNTRLVKSRTEERVRRECAEVAKNANKKSAEDFMNNSRDYNIGYGDACSDIASAIMGGNEK